MSIWRIKIGEEIKRTDLHDTYGGRRQGGISPSTVTKNIMIFTSPAGEEYGYLDGWQGDVFTYTGEGQEGDQQLKQGNKAILEHKTSKRTIRLFKGARGVVQYVGAFDLDNEDPYYTTDAPDINDEMRKVFIFRLISVGEILNANLPNATEAWKPGDILAQCEFVPTENQSVEHFTTDFTSASTSQRRESILVQSYLKYRHKMGRPKLSRLKIKPSGEAQYLYSDLFSATENELIESKGTVTRESIRMAIGQLFDYRRFVKGDSRLSILVPECPRPDLVKLLLSLNISIIYSSTGGKFITISN